MIVSEKKNEANFFNWIRKIEKKNFLLKNFSPLNYVSFNFFFSATYPFT